MSEVPPIQVSEGKIPKSGPVILNTEHNYITFRVVLGLW